MPGIQQVNHIGIRDPDRNVIEFDDVKNTGTDGTKQIKDDDHGCS